jgi:hypothetical protein
VRKLLLVVAMLALSSAADAATVVLKGGKKLDVVGLQRQGNYVVVKYANGRGESYPVAAVDLDATKAANEVPGQAAAPAPAAPAGAHSPFFGAQSNPGKPVVVVTDDDVQHIVPADDAEPTGGVKTAQRSSSEGMVTLVDYGKQKADDGTWEITANVINNGGAAVAGISAEVRLLDEKGATVGTGTAAYAGTLGPSQQAAMTTRVSCPVEPIQIGFSFHWQTVTPQPTPVPAPAAPAAGSKPAASAAKAPAAGAAQPAGYTVPPGSSPNTMASDPMALPGNLTQPPTSLQVPRGSSEAKQPG